VSKKTIAFTMPAASPRAREAEPAGRDEAAGAAPAPAQPDDWVRDRDLDADALRLAPAAPSRVVLDLTAERTLAEIAALSLLVPFALGWVWWVNALAGRTRF
jgi:hypothetical protein